MYKLHVSFTFKEVIVNRLSFLVESDKFMSRDRRELRRLVTYHIL